ncbi:hypothetical protein CC80DRAFT_228568 [Byssothecium circinans]|uniref:Uncharacterized protein n=1 Tax=Byssothecium circinans TaxID=147558 RepID=A0A6A5TD33_9PLEO|nr:hypothetical protein CC80DRAFT_228568 [Byssothecium circinans]
MRLDLLAFHVCVLGGEGRVALGRGSGSAEGWRYFFFGGGGDERMVALCMNCPIFDFVFYTFLLCPCPSSSPSSSFDGLENRWVIHNTTQCQCQCWCRCQSVSERALRTSSLPLRMDIPLSNHHIHIHITSTAITCSVLFCSINITHRSSPSTHHLSLSKVLFTFTSTLTLFLQLVR